MNDYIERDKLLEQKPFTYTEVTLDEIIGGAE